MACQDHTAHAGRKTSSVGHTPELVVPGLGSRELGVGIGNQDRRAVEGPRKGSGSHEQTGIPFLTYGVAKAADVPLGEGVHRGEDDVVLSCPVLYILVSFLCRVQFRNVNLILEPGTAFLDLVPNIPCTIRPHQDDIGHPKGVQGILHITRQ